MRPRLAGLVAGAALAAFACGGSTLSIAVHDPTPTPWSTDEPATVDATHAAPAMPPRPAIPAAATPAPVPPAPLPTPLASPTPFVLPLGVPQMVHGVLVGSKQQQLTNQARAAAGLRPLAWSTCLAGVASSHALEMANAGRIFHGDGVDRDLECGLDATRSGENVGDVSTGVDDQRIFNAFMQSPDHRANILGQYRFIGTAWVVAVNGTGYLSVEFAG